MVQLGSIYYKFYFDLIQVYSSSHYNLGRGTMLNETGREPSDILTHLVDPPQVDLTILTSLTSLHQHAKGLMSFHVHRKSIFHRDIVTWRNLQVILAF